MSSKAQKKSGGQMNIDKHRVAAQVTLMIVISNS